MLINTNEIQKQLTDFNVDGYSPKQLSSKYSNWNQVFFELLHEQNKTQIILTVTLVTIFNNLAIHTIKQLAQKLDVKHLLEPNFYEMVGS